MILFSLLCGLVTFSSCGKDDDDEKEVSDKTDVIDMGWVEWTWKDMNGNVLDDGKSTQNSDGWNDAEISFNWDATRNFVGFWISDANVGYPRVFKNISSGTYKVGDDSDSVNLVFEMSYHEEYFSPSENQKHTITSVEKIGRFYNGNYLYAIEGNFDIKVDNKYRLQYSEDLEIKEFRLACKYRMIVESDYFAENE